MHAVSPRRAPVDPPPIRTFPSEAPASSPYLQLTSLVGRVLAGPSPSRIRPKMLSAKPATPSSYYQQGAAATVIRASARASWIVCLSSGLLAQSAPSIRPFEVASVKLHQGPGRIGINTSGPRLNAVAAGPLLLIMYAFNLKSYQISRTSALLALGDEFYDIAAKAEG